MASPRIRSSSRVLDPALPAHEAQLRGGWRGGWTRTPSCVGCHLATAGGTEGRPGYPQPGSLTQAWAHTPFPGHSRRREGSGQSLGPAQTQCPGPHEDWAGGKRWRGQPCLLRLASCPLLPRSRGMRRPGVGMQRPLDWSTERQGACLRPTAERDVWPLSRALYSPQPAEALLHRWPGPSQGLSPGCPLTP